MIYKNRIRISITNNLKGHCEMTVRAYFEREESKAKRYAALLSLKKDLRAFLY